MKTQKEPVQQIFTELEALEQHPTSSQKLRALAILINGVQSNHIQMPDNTDLGSVVVRLRSLYDRLSDIDNQLTTAIKSGMTSKRIH